MSATYYKLLLAPDGTMRRIRIVSQEHMYAEMAHRDAEIRALRRLVAEGQEAYRLARAYLVMAAMGDRQAPARFLRGLL